jgi:hypothetical protein
VIGLQHQMPPATGRFDQPGLGLGKGAPQQEDLGPGSLAVAWISASVSASQPRPAWLAAWASSTVSTVLSSSTPWRAQATQRPLGAAARPGLR